MSSSASCRSRATGLWPLWRPRQSSFKEPSMFPRSAPRILLACCVTLTFVAPALAQAGETMTDSLRRLFENIPTIRLADTLDKSGVIVMDGEGSVRVRPDAARIRVGVVTESASANEVAQENATRMSSVVEAIKKAVGDSAPSVEIRTEAVSLAPIYSADQGASGRPQKITGYRATNDVRVLVRDLEKRSALVPSIIEQANTAGANEISGPEFLVCNDAKPLVEARVNAVENARTKAETYAKALNVRLGRVLTVTELERGHRPMPMMARAKADMPPPIETGTNEIIARVTVIWELKQD